MIIEPEDFETTCTLTLPIDREVDTLRAFDATVRCFNEEFYCGDASDGFSEIGTLHGWVGQQIQNTDVAYEADAISSEASVLGTAASSIIDQQAPESVVNVLLIDQVNIEAQWYAPWLSPIIDSLLHLLHFSPHETVVVLHSEDSKTLRGHFAPVQDSHPWWTQLIRNDYE